MARTKRRQELESVVRYAADGLAATEVAALAAHPDAVRSALAVVASRLSSSRADGSCGDEIETIAGTAVRRVDAGEADMRMSSRTRPGRKEELLTSDESAALAGFKTRQSVHDWRRKGKIVGWRGAGRRYVFPAAQFDERGRPPNGLDRIVPRFADGYAAWIWLTTPRPSLNGAKPLALLNRGECDRVAAAAEGDAQGDFA